MEVALRREPRVGVDHDPPRHGDLTGEIAGRRQPRPGPQGAVPDRAAKLLLELRAEGLGVTTVHGHQELYRLTGLVCTHNCGPPGMDVDPHLGVRGECRCW